MDFRIADTFTDSLARLTGDEQKSVKTTAFDLQMNPANPGMQFHKLDKAKDKNFWSVRVNRDIRLIVHKTQSSLLLCYVNHHDDAYRWAERRKLETHPKTGAAQLVEIRERVEEIVVPKIVETPQQLRAKPVLFSDLSNDKLLSFGVPQEWLRDVRLATEDTLLKLADHLPREAAEALLEVATGGTPQIFVPPTKTVDPFSHPDAQRRFRVMSDVAELERALESPWEKWTIFLHPAQRELVEGTYSGAIRVSGSAGTGKTIVAIHRAVFLARHNLDARVLVTTFSEALANALRYKIRRLIGKQPRLGERIDVESIDAIGRRLCEKQFGALRIVTDVELREALTQASSIVQGHKFSLRFLRSEWDEVVDAWQLGSWEEYRDVRRLGRKTRLPEPQRQILWNIFEAVRSNLKEKGVVTQSEMFSRFAAVTAARKNAPFDHVVVDESQDLTVAQFKFLAAFGANQPDRLFFAGDLGQRIFQTPFSWKSLGVDVRGRSKTLHVNYRTSHQIRSQADRLLGPEVADVDGNTEDRRGTISVFNGPAPEIQIVSSEQAETDCVAGWLSARINDGVTPNEIGVFVRSSNELRRAEAALAVARVQFNLLDHRFQTADDRVSLSTMHLAKGLEFRAVVVMACDDEVIPSQERIEAIADDADLEEVYNTERHLLYVACTRARDYLLVTSVAPASEFLDDLK